MKKKAVLDTNVFVSILKKGRLRKILDFWLDEKLDLVISDAIIREIFIVLNRPKFNFSFNEIEELGDLIFEKALICIPQQKLKICSDPDDNKFIECAVEGKADYIVTGDHHLLEIKKFQKIAVVSPSEFIKQFSR